MTRRSLSEACPCVVSCLPRRVDGVRWERVDGAARDAIDAARATTRGATAVGRDANECCTVETPRRYREMMEVSRRKDGAFDGRAKRPSRPNRAASWTCALYSVASAVEGRGARRKSQGRSLSSRTSPPK